MVLHLLCFVDSMGDTEVKHVQGEQLKTAMCGDPGARSNVLTAAFNLVACVMPPHWCAAAMAWA